MFVYHRHAVIMPVVDLKLDKQFVNVFAIIMEIHMKDVDQNVLEILIAQ